MTASILTEEVVAEQLGCAVTTIRTLVKERRLRAARFGDGGYRFSERLLLEDLERECNGPPLQIPASVTPIGIAVAPVKPSGPPRLVPMMEPSEGGHVGGLR